MIPALSALRACCAFVAATLLLSSSVAFAGQTGQRNDQSAPRDTADLARGWTELSQGNSAAASQLADSLIAQNPRSSAVLAFAIEAAIARGGASAALDTYERWLGSRTVEAPYILRRVATIVLRGIAGSDAAAGYRVLAIQALRADGETDLSSLAVRGAAATGADPSVAAAAGSSDGITSLARQLSIPGPMRQSAIASLGASHARSAEAPLVDLLKDPDPMVREAAANALGSLGSTEAIEPLKTLLKDPAFGVHFAAAQALVALNDSTADAWLQSLESSDHSSVKVAAARALKTHAGDDWQALVRQLTTDPDPEVRRQAAELIAPYDPELARKTLDSLMQDPNPAERQAAQDSYVEYAATDFTFLRRQLRVSETLTRIRAASRILALTR